MSELQAKDLRIRNLIKLQGVVIRISCIKLDIKGYYIGIWNESIGGLPNGFLKLSIFEPIPLNAEWIERAGFEKVDDSHYKKHILRFGKIHSYRRDNNIFEFELGQRSGYTLGLIPNLNHVHQLQNLFHAITGEELEFKTQQP